MGLRQRGHSRANSRARRGLLGLWGIPTMPQTCCRPRSGAQRTQTLNPESDANPGLTFTPTCSQGAGDPPKIGTGGNVRGVVAACAAL